MNVMRRRGLFPALLILFLAIGCAPGSNAALPLPASSLRPYLTATSVVLTVPTRPASAVPIPTPTPSTYKVAPGDTMSGIAARFAIRLDDLLAANPGVVPEALSVGQALQIPASSPKGAGVSSPTPAPVETGQVACHASGAGLYCLALVHNPLPETLENIQLQISLIDPSGRSLASREALLPLDILPAGSRLPAYAFFPAAEAGSQPVVQLIASNRLTQGDARYLPVIIRNVLVSVEWNGLSGQVQGQVFLPGPNRTAHSLWLAAVAYDRDDRIAGFRRWGWQGNLEPGGIQPFTIQVYSFGATIDRVEVIAEARP